jgi:hypothetical protein
LKGILATLLVLVAARCYFGWVSNVAFDHAELVAKPTTVALPDALGDLLRVELELLTTHVLAGRIWLALLLVLVDLVPFSATLALAAFSTAFALPPVFFGGGLVVGLLVFTLSRSE